MQRCGGGQNWRDSRMLRVRVRGRDVRLRREGLQGIVHAFPSNVTRDGPPITRVCPPSLLILLVQGSIVTCEERDYQGLYTPFLLILQGMALQLQGIAFPFLLALQGRSLTAQRVSSCGSAGAQASAAAAGTRTAKITAISMARSIREL